MASAAARTGIPLSPDPVRLLAAGLALDSRRLSSPRGTPEPEPFFAPCRRSAVDPKTLIFALGELPFITGLYERGRRELTPDDNLSVDGVKEMVLEASERLRGASIPGSPADHAAVALDLLPLRPQPLADRSPADARPLLADRGGQANRRRRLCPGRSPRRPENIPTPSRRRLRTRDEPPSVLRMGDRSGRSARLGNGVRWSAGCRARRSPGGPASCGHGPAARSRSAGKQRWDPFGMCSWPPEDDRIESFHRHVRDQARAILGVGPGPRREVHDQRPRRHRHPGNLAELAYRRPLRQGYAARPRLHRGRRLPVRSAGRSPGLHPSRHLVSPSTPRNRRWRSTRPIP